MTESESEIVVEFERKVIGALSSVPRDCVAPARAVGLEGQMFINPTYGRLFDWMLGHLAENPEAEIIGLPEMADGIRKLDPTLLSALGGLSGLAQVAQWECSSAGFPAACERVRAAAGLRTYLSRLESLSLRAQGGAGEAELAEGTREAAKGLLRSTSGQGRSLTGRDVVRIWFEAEEAARSGDLEMKLPTGIGPLDHVLGGGIPRRGLTLIGGSTGGGKTALACQIATAGIVKGRGVHVFSLEMDELDMSQRLISSMGRVSMEVVTDPLSTRTKDELERIERAAGQIAGSKFLMANPQVRSLAEIEKELAISTLDHRIDLVLVDYIQLVEGEKGEGREREVASVSKALHSMGLRYGCAVIGLTQLNEDGRSRESRAIEQDSKCYLLIGPDGVTVRKNRQGRPGVTAQIYLDGEFQTFRAGFES